MNPFSAFLQPVSRPLQAPDAFGDLSKMVQSRKELSERQREADQNNAVQQGYLGVQQKNQEHQFAEKDRAEVEGLIQEYQDAVARGEPQQIQDAVQKMKRFGLDVQQQAPAPEKTSISPFTGLPFQPHNPLKSQSPVVGDETSHAARADDPNDDRLLDQKEFEDKLIGNSFVDSGISNSVTDGGYDMPGGNDPGDAGRGGKVMDLDAPASPGATAQPAGAPPPQLPGMLPVIVKRGDKELYRSGQQGRWSPLVQGVFGPLAEQKDPRAAEAGRRAQALTEKYIATDGISPEKAIKFGMDAYEKDMARASAELRTTIGSKARPTASQREPSETPHIYDNTARQQAATIQKEDVRYASLEDKLNSGDPGLQRDALNELYTIRAGTAVSAAEDNRVSGINSLLDKWDNKFRQWTGGQMSPDMLRAMQQIVASKRAINSDMVERIYNHQADVYESYNKGKVTPEQLKTRSVAIRQGSKVVPGGSGGEKSEEDLY